MAIENYETYTKNILEMIFNNQDIEQLLPYLSKNTKAMGLNTEGILTYDDIINHLKQYKSNQFTFFIDEFNTNIIYQNDSVCVIEGSFILHMEEYQATTQYFYSIVLKNNQIELLHTSIGNNISHEKEGSFSLPICSFKLDKNLTIIDINDHLLNLLLYHSKEEFLNDVQNQWINCIHKNDVYHVIETLSKDVSSLERHQLEYRIRRKDHSYLWVYDQGQFIFNLQKDVLVQSCISDITPIKNRELNS